MKRSLALICLLACGVIAAPLSAADADPASSQVSGTVVSLGWSSVTLRTGGRRMSVARALTAAANLVTREDYPYVFGGGHAEAGTASIGIKGPGYNGRRVGLDCSGSVGAVLAGAGLMPAGMPVPDDAGIIAELRQAKLIIPGAGRGPGAVTLYDKRGVHIFMRIGERYFGTSDGGAGNPAQRRGGAGWLNDGAPDVLERAFRPWHLVSDELSAPTIYGPTLTFQMGAADPLLQGVAVGDRLRVSYMHRGEGALRATAVTYADARTATGTVTAIADDESTLTVQTGDGRSLTLGVSDPRLLDWTSVGDGVQVTYTRGAEGALTARAVVHTTAVSPPST